MQHFLKSYSFFVKTLSCIVLSLFLLPLINAKSTSTSIPVSLGWNLLGNATTTSINVSSTFSDPASVVSVWKWDAATSTWAFYAPSYSDGGANYASTQGYEFLDTIYPGEGYWVNSSKAFSISSSSTTSYGYSNFVFSSPTTLLSGWNLISIGDSILPAAFNLYLNSSSPPSAGALPTVNISSLWAWDSKNTKWFFYSPSLDDGTSLQNYINQNGYEGFKANNMLLTNGVGFWVNNPNLGVVAIKGTLSGLAQGTSVVLTNMATGSNTTSTQRLTDNGLFSWSLNKSGEYAITVSSQPTGQTCTVSNGSGSITTGITNILVGCTSNSSTSSTSSNGSVSSSTTTTSGTSTTTTSSITTTTLNNTVPINVNGGPNGSYNLPLVTITVCKPGTSTCVDIPNVEIDTGSTGVRLFASSLTSLGLSPVVGATGNPTYECYAYVNSYVFGKVMTADVKIAGETAPSLSIQVMNDTTTSGPPVPSDCAGYGQETDTVATFGANGIIGVNNTIFDCGLYCSTTSSQGYNPIYYEIKCTTSASTDCVNSYTTMPLSKQVNNPVANFAADNNGVIIQLPSIPAAGASSLAGSMIFGINTQSNNVLASTTPKISLQSGSFVATLNGTSLPGSYFDSGTADLVFPASSTFPACKVYTGYLCPGNSSSLSLTTVSPTIPTASGNVTVNFSVANAEYLLNSTNQVFSDVADPVISGTTSVASANFVFGLAAFIGHTVYTGFQTSKQDVSYDGAFIAYK